MKENKWKRNESMNRKTINIETFTFYLIKVAERNKLKWLQRRLKKAVFDKLNEIGLIPLNQVEYKWRMKSQKSLYEGQ